MCSEYYFFFIYTNLNFSIHACLKLLQRFVYICWEPRRSIKLVGYSFVRAAVAFSSTATDRNLGLDQSSETPSLM